MGELARSFNNMADSVEESFKRLEEARAKAEEASRLKSAFLANVSHELRTPLNGILGFAEMLKSDIEDPEHREYARIIHQSGEHLLGLVSEILDLAKIEAGEMQFNWQQASATEIAEQCAQLHRASAEARGLALSLELAEGLPDSIETDPTRLRQMLNNLLSNAIKFTDQGGVELSVRRAGNEIVFAVRDSGPGIAPEHHEVIFEKFKQLEHFITRAHGGTGLGLAIVRQLAQQMGGRVELASALGEGATFSLHFPLDAKHEQS